MHKLLFAVTGHRTEVNPDCSSALKNKAIIKKPDFESWALLHLILFLELFETLLCSCLHKKVSFAMYGVFFKQEPFALVISQDLGAWCENFLWLPLSTPVRAAVLTASHEPSPLQTSCFAVTVSHWQLRAPGTSTRPLGCLQPGKHKGREAAVTHRLSGVREFCVTDLGDHCRNKNPLSWHHPISGNTDLLRQNTKLDI